MLARIIDNSIDRIGDWNPQLFRELKARVSPRTVLATSLVSIGIEFLLLGILPSSNLLVTNQWIYSGLILIGVYFLIADLERERKSGTIDFIKLTPQSGRSILVGKLWGVPSLVYLVGIAIAPMEIWLLLMKGIGLLTILLWYLAVVAIAYAAFSTAILYGVVGHKSAILGTILICPAISIAMFCAEGSLALSRDYIYINWYFLPLSSPPINAGIIILSCLGLSYWWWVAIDRKYVNSYHTLFTKANSYFFNLGFHLWLFGFIFAAVAQVFDPEQRGNIIVIAYLCNTLSAIWIGLFHSWLVPKSSQHLQWQPTLPIEPKTDLAIERQQRNIWQVIFTTDEHVSEDVLLFAISTTSGLFWSILIVISSPLTEWYHIFICVFTNLFGSMASWIISFVLYSLLFNRSGRKYQSTSQ
jgi:ABC-type transport system involved in cytochrome c biogenesis permease component